MRAGLIDSGDLEQPEMAVWTDTTGCVLKATTGAAQLLGVSRRSLVHRLMYMYVTADRKDVLVALESAGRGHEESRESDGRSASGYTCSSTRERISAQ